VKKKVFQSSSCFLLVSLFFLFFSIFGIFDCCTKELVRSCVGNIEHDLGHDRPSANTQF
jgi:hypothetical protein